LIYLPPLSWTVTEIVTAVTETSYRTSSFFFSWVFSCPKDGADTAQKNAVAKKRNTAGEERDVPLVFRMTVSLRRSISPWPSTDKIARQKPLVNETDRHANPVFLFVWFEAMAPGRCSEEVVEGRSGRLCGRDGRAWRVDVHHGGYKFPVVPRNGPLRKCRCRHPYPNRKESIS